MTAMAPDDDAREIGDNEISADEIDTNFAARRRDGVATVEIDGELVVTSPSNEGDDPHSIGVHWLDGQASIIWEYLDGSTSLGELVDDLAAGFGADRAAVERDVMELARSLGGVGLLEGVAPDPPPVDPAAGVPIGTEVPEFRFDDLDGQAHGSDEFRGRPMLLVNWSANCGYCVQIAPDLAQLSSELRDEGIETVFMTIGSVSDNRVVVDDAGLDCLMLFREGFALFDGLGTPAAYFIDEELRVASDLALGAPNVTQLAASRIPAK